MKRKIVFILFLSIIFLQYTQITDKKTFKTLFLEGEYFFLRGEYDEARFIYSELLKENPDNYNLNFLIAACYLSNYGEKLKAIPYLEVAVTNISTGYREGSYKETGAPKESIFALARAYHISGQFDKALVYYEKYGNVMKLKDVAEIDYLYKQIESCRTAQKMVKKPIAYKREEVPLFNKNHLSDYNPVFSGKDSILIYTSDKTFYSAIMMCRLKNGVWQEPIVINDQLGADDNCHVCSINPGGDKIFLSQREEDGSFDLYSSTLKKGKWSKMKKLNEEINTFYDETHAVVTPDENYLFFTSNRPGGMGAMDIYVSKKNSRDDWEIPIPLGEPINSPYSEETPFFSEDGKILFFSSMGHSTMGGFDVFYSSRLPDGRWSFPANIGYPVSTSDDDLFFFPLGNGRTAYYSGFMNTGEGNQTICFVDLDTTKNINSVALKGQIKLKDNIMEFDSGFSVNVIDKSLVKDTLATLSPDKKTGVYSMNLNPGNYDVIIKGEGYSDKTENVSIVQGISQNEINMESGLSPASVTSGEFLTIKNVLFDFNSDKLDQKSLHEIEKLFKIMELHPAIYVQITGHADAVGKETYNINLSIRRARRIVDYLVNKGISKERFISRGVGESESIAINTNPDGTDNPSGRRLNRYAEIKLINNSDINIKVEDIYVPEYLRPKANQRYSVMLKESDSRINNIPDKISGENIRMIEADKGYLYLAGNFTSKEDALILLNEAIDNGYPNAGIVKNSEISEMVNSMSDLNESGKGPFTIQILALRKAINPADFKSFENLTQYISGDNFFRYTTGIYFSRDSARTHLQKIINRGFPDAFIVELSAYEVNPDITINKDYFYTIQFSATRKPSNKKEFKKISNIRMNFGDDGYYRYTSGIYSSRYSAQVELNKIRSLGFSDAFIKKIKK